MPTAENTRAPSEPPELYTSRIVHAWLEYLAEAHPGIDLTELLEASGINSLHLDDVVEQRELAAMILTELGYRVNTVESGE